jgi:hypothetical protein
MAKTKTPDVKIVRVPSMSPATRAKAKAAVSRGFSAAARTALEEKHTIAAVAAGGVLGYIESRRVSVPKIDALGVAGTYGTLAWVLGRYTKSPTMQHVATGLLACGMRDLVATTGASVPGPSTSGDLYGGEI